LAPVRRSHWFFVFPVATIVGLSACSSSSGSKGTAPTPPAHETTTTGAPTPTTSRIPTSVELARVATGLDSPVALAWRANDPRLYVAEQSGKVRLIDNGRALPTPVLALDVSSGNEQGLLGIAFSLDGTKLYVDFTDPDGDSHVVEYTMNGDIADVTQPRELLFRDQPFANHNGGELLMARDGTLYIGFGDGGGAGDPSRNGQNLDTWLGKILRIDPKPTGNAPYTVPESNPFVGQRGREPEIWAYGLRNPWRFAFDRATNAMWIGDVGQNRYEEIDYAPARGRGANYGWSIREALHEYNDGPSAGLTDPIVELDHSDGWCAVVGGYVYRGKAIPELNGVYVYGDNCRTPLVGLVQRNGHVTEQRELGVDVDALTTFGEDANGELYAAARGGSVYRLVAG
jgi:glucose/arabinose dehydrogenase